MSSHDQTSLPQSGITGDASNTGKPPTSVPASTSSTTVSTTQSQSMPSSSSQPQRSGPQIVPGFQLSSHPHSPAISNPIPRSTPSSQSWTASSSPRNLGGTVVRPRVPQSLIASTSSLSTSNIRPQTLPQQQQQKFSGSLTSLRPPSSMSPSAGVSSQPSSKPVSLTPASTTPSLSSVPNSTATTAPTTTVVNNQPTLSLNASSLATPVQLGTTATLLNKPAFGRPQYRVSPNPPGTLTSTRSNYVPRTQTPSSTTPVAPSSSTSVPSSSAQNVVLITSAPNQQASRMSARPQTSNSTSVMTSQPTQSTSTMSGKLPTSAQPGMTSSYRPASYTTSMQQHSGNKPAILKTTTTTTGSTSFPSRAPTLTTANPYPYSRVPQTSLSTQPSIGSAPSSTTFSSSMTQEQQARLQQAVLQRQQQPISQAVTSQMQRNPNPLSRPVSTSSNQPVLSLSSAPSMSTSQPSHPLSSRPTTSSQPTQSRQNPNLSLASSRPTSTQSSGYGQNPNLSLASSRPTSTQSSGYGQTSNLSVPSSSSGVPNLSLSGSRPPISMSTSTPSVSSGTTYRPVNPLLSASSGSTYRPGTTSSQQLSADQLRALQQQMQAQQQQQRITTPTSNYRPTSTHASALVRPNGTSQSTPQHGQTSSQPSMIRANTPIRAPPPSSSSSSSTATSSLAPRPATPQNQTQAAPRSTTTSQQPARPPTNQIAPAPLPDWVVESNAPLLPRQEQQLQKIISAYRSIAGNKAVPHDLAKSLQGPQVPQKPAARSFEMPSRDALKGPPLTPSTKLVQFNSSFLEHELALNIRHRMAARFKKLKMILSDPQKLESLKPKQRLKLKMELLSIQNVEMQRTLRKGLYQTMKATSGGTLPFKLNTKRSRDQLFKTTAKVEKMSRQIRQEKLKRIRAQKLEFINSVLTHAKEFRNFHKAVRSQSRNCAMSVLSYWEKKEREERRLEAEREKERLKKLMESDEEGYRKLIDKQKNKRLAMLLEKTDEHMEFMQAMVNQHQQQERRQSVGPGEGETGSTSDETKEVTDVEALASATDLVGKDAYGVGHNIQEKIDYQPDILVGGQLKPYQMKALQWMVSLYNNKLNGILADEMGLGKTIQTIALLAYLYEKKNNFGPFLIVVPLSTLPNWLYELQKWCPKLRTIGYRGSKQERKRLGKTLTEAKFNVLVTTYEYVMRDKSTLRKMSWKYLVIDEGHKMKNANSKLSLTLTQHYDCTRRLLLTGTPLQNNLTELWALLNFLLPSIFKSAKNFEEWFNAPFAGTGESVELSNEEQMLIIQRLHKVLRPFLLRRKKTEVENELPKKVEYILKCEMSALQKKLYVYMKKYGIILTESGGIQEGARSEAKALQNTLVQLRKICNHPYLFKEVEMGINKHLYGSTQVHNTVDLWRASGKFEMLMRILPKLRQTGHKVLIFCQMTSIMTVLEDFLVMHAYKYLRLDGATKADDRGMFVQQFTDQDHDLFLLSTRAGGLGLNLQVADTVILFESDWNPHQDLQAQDRAHRIGSKNEVRVFRIITINSVEEKILDAARFKLNVDEKVIQAGMFSGAKTDAKDRRQYLRTLLEQENEDADEELPPTADELNEMLARSDAELEKFKEMDQAMAEADRAWMDERRKTRLMATSELPAWVNRDERAVKNLVSQIRGEVVEEIYHPRKRKEIAYTDNLSEKEWLDAVEAGDLEERARSKRRKVGSITPRPVRNRKAAFQTPVPLESDKPMAKVLYQSLEDLIALTDSEGLLVAQEFLTLPNSRKLPEYFKVIERPIALDTLRSKVSHNVYKTLDEFESDLSLMWNNAKQFNSEESQIAKNAERLLNVFQEKKSSYQQRLTELEKEAAQKQAEEEKARKEAEELAKAQQEAVQQPEDEEIQQEIVSEQAESQVENNESESRSDVAPPPSLGNEASNASFKMDEDEDDMKSMASENVIGGVGGQDQMDVSKDDNDDDDEDDEDDDDDDEEDDDDDDEDDDDDDEDDDDDPVDDESDEESD